MITTITVRYRWIEVEIESPDRWRCLVEQFQKQASQGRDHGDHDPARMTPVPSKAQHSSMLSDPKRNTGKLSNKYMI